MFYRNTIHELRKWAKRDNRKPLILRGARQVGKTTLVNQFGKEFDTYLKLNLEEPEHFQLFENYTNMEALLTGIYLVNEAQRKTNSTLLFIDEIQNSPRAVSLLRYFYEKTPHLYVIAAGSLLESLIDKHISFPVGRVEYMSVRPCSFNEFLSAIGKTEWQKAQLTASIPLALHQTLMSLFNQYALTGGMPEIVANYAITHDIISLGNIYDALLTGYRDDLEKYAPTETMRNIMRHILLSGWNYAAQRIKFERFGESNYRSREVGEAFRLMEKAMLLELVYPYGGYQIPIIPELSHSPKLLWIDTGLVNFVAGIQKEIFGIKDISEAWRGKVAEQIVGQELLSANNRFSYKRHFWARDTKTSIAEVDFIVQMDDLLIPVEVKSGHNAKLRSLHLFMENAPHSTAVRIWSNPFSIDEIKTPKGKSFTLYNIPFYYTGNLEQILKTQPR
ncbi:ATPase [Bacteroidia bacterium]|nr:ATPase [Bacteroidia bacterium]